KACVLPENPASYRVVRTKSYLFNKALSGKNFPAKLQPESPTYDLRIRRKLPLKNETDTRIRQNYEFAI
ncbi:hypothetical protein, partial [Enterobacter roggenkampii]|uniref:hypothetical protein n=1 Tax=Enterobacter roggenkampii TaxID=1812935 RepID=UPI002FF964F3